jgi:hypothetical protein
LLAPFLPRHPNPYFAPVFGHPVIPSVSSAPVRPRIWRG